VKGRLWAPAVVGLGWLLALAYERGTDPPVTDIVFLSVGQGDAILLRSGDKAVLVDTGPSQGAFSAGERLAAPQLRALGVDDLEAVILTHPDLDHTGGFEGLQRRLTVTMCYTAPTFVDRLPCRAIPGRLIVGAWTLEFWTDAAADTDNGQGVVIRAMAGQESVLLTADISQTGERRIPAAIVAYTTIVKAGHHGSGSSTSADLLESADPEWVVFSCGRGNSFGHPDEEALRRAEESGAQIARTDRDGPVRFVLRGGRFERAPL